jgi:predicted MFS family arabinose efflux permease
MLVAPRRPVLPRPVAFATLSAVLVAVMVGAGAPAPLYVLYQQEFGLPDSAVTGAFVLYILPAALVLLVGGRLSDHVGRRPVALLAVLLGLAGSAVLFAVDGLGTLLLGRVLQGLAAGLTTGALGAYVVDLQGPGRGVLAAAVAGAGPTVGLALGAVGSGALVQFGGMPPSTVFVIVAVVLCAGALGLALAPETCVRRPGALRSLRPQMTVPRGTRLLFAAVTCGFVASWALGGFYQTLGPSVGAHLLGHDGRLFGGIVVASLIGSSVLGGPLTGPLRPFPAVLVGNGLLALGTVVAVVSIGLGAAVPFLLGSVVAGTGFGAVFAGGLRLLLGGADQDTRGGLLSAGFLVAYLGSAVPTFVAGRLTPGWGLWGVTVGVGALVVLLALVSSGIALGVRREPAR